MAERSYLIEAPILTVPPAFAAPLLVLLKAGRREHRSAIGPEISTWLRDLEKLAGIRAAEVASSVASLRRMTVAEACSVTGLKARTITGMAPKLGGEMVAGRWLLNAEAVHEYAGDRSVAVGGRSVTDRIELAS